MIGGYERYFQIARCFRDEDFRADRQPEFTQLDMELSFVEEEDVFDVVDRLLQRVLALGGIEVSLPLERITYDEAMLRYGSDRPDRRLGVEIVDLTEVFRASEFKVFAARCSRRRGARAEGTRRVPAQPLRRTSPRRPRRSARRGSPGRLSRRAGWRSPIAKFLVRGRDRAGERRTGCAARATRSSSSPTRPRSRRACSARCGRRWPRASPRGTTCSGSSTSRPSSGTRTRGAGTRCTTRSRARPATSSGDPGTWRSRAYDVVFDGWEIGGGSIRISDPEVQQKVFERSASDPRRRRSASASCSRRSPTARRRTAAWRSASTGWSPCSPARASIRDVIAFPKAASGVDPLTGAPAPVDERQLDELGVKVVAPPTPPSEP